jgi:hypothetical protein
MAVDWQPENRTSWSLAWKAISLAAVAVALLAVAARPSPTQATHSCAATGSPLGPFNLEAYEAVNWRTTYGRTFDLAGNNLLFWDKPSFALPALEKGSRSAGSGTLANGYVPPALLKAIAWIESGWAMADYSVPYGGVGPPLLSHSCAYGVSQVLSGMQNFSGVPSLDQAMIGSHFAFNVARGAEILIDKWNAAPEFRPIVGTRDPTKIENWYYAVWSYHGWTYDNHPKNSVYSSSRPAYLCDGTQARSNYPYQELVFGCVKNPPVIGGQRLWDPIAVKLPSLSSSAFTTANWNECSGSYDCADMDISTPSPSHTDPTTPAVSRGGVIGWPTISPYSTTLNLIAPPGGAGPQASVTIANTNSGVLSWRAKTSASWLQIVQRQGISTSSRNSKVTVKANAAGLAGGTYTADLIIESGWATNGPRTITVKLTVSTPCAPFSDLLESHWACSSIQALYDANIAGGCSTSPLQFCPGSNTSRADIAVLLLNAMGHAGHLPSYQGYFSDVPSGQWYTGYVEHLFQHAVTSGYGDGSFRPGASVSRAEAAVFIIRALGEAPLASPSGTKFTDVPASHWAAGYIEQAAKWGIVGGYGDGTFRPDAPLAREEAAVLIAQAWNLPHVTRSAAALLILRPMSHDGHNGSYQGYFTDVTNGLWYTGYVEHLKSHNITSGYPDGTYAPGAGLKRAEAAVFIVRALGQAPLSNPTGTVFSDVPKSHWAAGYIEKLAQLGITSGYANGTFQPDKAIVRSELTALTARAWP